MKIASRRCTMGAGRQFAFKESEGSHIMVLDTDVVYSELLRRLVDQYLDHHSMFSLQAIFCGLFPRQQWINVGGRRNLNTNEDVDMWIRLWRLGTMRWYPVSWVTTRRSHGRKGAPTTVRCAIRREKGFADCSAESGTSL